MKLSRLILVAVFSVLGLTAYGDTYKVDPVHSSLVFSAKHFGVTDFYGQFKEINGTVTFDAADPSKSSVEISVPVEGIDISRVLTFSTRSNSRRLLSRAPRLKAAVTTTRSLAILRSTA
jgi:hypothetical protein